MSQGGQNLPTKILIVDDDPAVAQGLDEPLSKYQIKVDKASNLETALYLFNTNRYDVCLVEVEFAPLPGLALEKNGVRTKYQKNDQLHSL